MSEETKEYDNDGLGPCLALYHPNARHTGSALRMWLHPAVAGQDGCISLKIAEQDGSHDRFDWAHALYVQLKAVDLAKLLMVFQGWIEKLGDEGEGSRIRFSEGGVVTHVNLAHRIEPVPKYWLGITRDEHRPDGSVLAAIERVIALSPAEALAVSEAIRGGIFRVAFGDQRLVDVKEA